MRYDAIICDLGNVLIDFDHRIAVRKIVGRTLREEEAIYNFFFDSPLTGLYEEGKISSAEFFNRARDFLMLDIDYDTFLPLWNEIFFQTPRNIKMQEFLSSAKAGYKLVMISNLNEAHFEFLSKTMPIFSIFDKLVLSYKEGFRKPDPEIYRRALRYVNTPVSKAFYIDDRKDLVEAASRLGIKGMVFNGESSLAKIKGILCPDF